MALLQFAGKVNANSSAVTRADVEATMCAGWTEAQVAEAVHIAALFAALNRIANGFGLGSEADVAPYFLARYFGRKHFSVLYGLTWTAYAIGGATGPLWIGHLYDRAGAYLPRFIVYLAAVAFGAVILSFFLQSDPKRSFRPEKIYFAFLYQHYNCSTDTGLDF